MPTPAEEITTAAAKLERLLNAISTPVGNGDTGFHTEKCGDTEKRGNCPCVIAQGHYSWHDGPPGPLYYVADAETPELAAFIATMGPPLARTIVRALKSWEGFEIREETALSEDFTFALTMAREINRDHSP